MTLRTWLRQRFCKHELLYKPRITVSGRMIQTRPSVCCYCGKTIRTDAEQEYLRRWAEKILAYQRAIPIFRPRVRP